jgi:hypothetical protein
MYSARSEIIPVNVLVVPMSLTTAATILPRAPTAGAALVEVGADVAVAARVAGVGVAAPWPPTGAVDVGALAAVAVGWALGALVVVGVGTAPPQATVSAASAVRAPSI